MMMGRNSFVGDVIILVNIVEEAQSLIVKLVIQIETDYLLVNILHSSKKKFLKWSVNAFQN